MTSWRPSDQRLSTNWPQEFIERKHNIDVPSDIMRMISAYNTFGWEAKRSASFDTSLYAMDDRNPDFLVRYKQADSPLGQRDFVRSAFAFEKGCTAEIVVRNHKRVANEWWIGVARADAEIDLAHDVFRARSTPIHRLRGYSRLLTFDLEGVRIRVDCRYDHAIFVFYDHPRQLDREPNSVTYGIEKALGRSNECAWQLVFAARDSGTKLEILRGEICG